jgi:hypothetical protein
MIKYTLTCPEGHTFDSWFSSGADYDRLAAAGHVSCPDVTKALMAPRVSTSEDRPLSQPASPAEQALKALKAKIESEAEDVGRNFPKEARAIHNGEAPERAIYGEARPEDAKALLSEGINVAPLPFRPTKRNS